LEASLTTETSVENSTDTGTAIDNDVNNSVDAGITADTYSYYTE
jgi:hypothetical protein